MGAETISDVGEDPDPVLQLDPVHAIRERLKNPTVDEHGRPGHEARLYRNLVFIPPLGRSHSRFIEIVTPRPSSTSPRSSR
jgi:hypothetical protein